MEIRKDVPGYEGKYLVSNLGNFIRVRNHKEVVLKTTLHRGYLQINLYKSGIRQQFRSHRIVATAFLENPENKIWVNHKNGVKTDNTVENLEWCSPSENELHSVRVLGKKPSMSQLGCFGGLNNNSKIVAQYLADGTLVNEFMSMTDASNALGVHRSTIGNCCAGRIKTAGGFVWKVR